MAPSQKTETSSWAPPPCLVFSHAFEGNSAGGWEPSRQLKKPLVRTTLLHDTSEGLQPDVTFPWKALRQKLQPWLVSYQPRVVILNNRRYMLECPRPGNSDCPAHVWWKQKG